MASTLSSSSSFTDVRNAYFDNASWEEDGSIAKAKALITAAKLLLTLYAEEVQNGSERLRMGLNLKEIREEMNRARAYVRGNKTPHEGGSGVSHFDFGGFRP